MSASTHILITNLNAPQNSTLPTAFILPQRRFKPNHFIRLSVQQSSRIVHLSKDHQNPLMRLTLLALALLLYIVSGPCFAGTNQYPFQKVAASEGQKYMPAQFVCNYAYSWTDVNGRNLLVFGEHLYVIDKRENQDPLSTCLIVGFHILVDRSNKVYWKMNDGVRVCPFDASAFVDSNSVALSDIDGDGEAEVTFLYKLSCTSDVSPDEFKQLTYVKAKKCAIRGSNVVDYGRGTKAGGAKRIDAAFTQVHTSLRTYASKLWDSNIARWKVAPHSD